MQRRNKRDRRAAQYINHTLRASLPEPTLDLGNNASRYSKLLDLICSNEPSEFTGTAHTRLDELEQMLARLTVLEGQSRMLLETGNHQHLNALDSSMTQTRKSVDRVESVIASELDDRRKDTLARPITDFFPSGWQDVLAGVWLHSVQVNESESIAWMHAMTGLHKLGHFANLPKDQEVTKIDMGEIMAEVVSVGRDMQADKIHPCDVSKWFYDNLMHPTTCGSEPAGWSEWTSNVWNPPV